MQVRYLPCLKPAKNPLNTGMFHWQQLIYANCYSSIDVFFACKDKGEFLLLT